MASARFPGHSNQVIVIGCYLPPTYTVSRGRAALEYIRDLVTQLKVTYRSPYIVVTGVFNQWDIARVLEDFADIDEADVGTTRGSRKTTGRLPTSGRP